MIVIHGSQRREVRKVSSFFGAYCDILYYFVLFFIDMCCIFISFCDVLYFFVLIYNVLFCAVITCVVLFCVVVY